MNILVKGKKVTIKEDELDIYTVAEFKETLKVLGDDGTKDVVLDLAAVESISTPAVQVIIAAQKTFKKLTVKNIQPGVKNCFRLIRVEL